jgi:hypothetical protein
MANTYTIKQTLEVTFSIPVSLQKDYKMLTEELTAKDSLIVNNIQDEVKDGTIDGSIIITVENGESIQDVIDDLELLEQGVSLQED